MTNDSSDPLTVALLHFGLGSREAQLYRTLLKYGPMSARQSINLSGLDRATGYRILSKLRARGLVTSTPSRPQRFVPLDVTRLFERSGTVLRDDLEFLRVLREHYMAEGSRLGRDSHGATHPTPAHPAPKTRWPTVQLYPRADDVARGVGHLVDGAKEELDLLMMPQVIPEALRTDILRSLTRAVDRGARVRLVLDYHPVDLDFLTGLLRGWSALPPGFEFRFYAPQLSRLYVADHRLALRCIRAAGSPSVGPELGLASDEAEWVRYQSTRFQAVWREALPMQRAEEPPTAGRGTPALESARDLRRWVERGAFISGRLAGTEFARLLGVAPGAARRL